MYRPRHFNPEDPALARELMRNFPFSTLMTRGTSDEAPLVDHAPLLLIGEKLIGHFSRANPHVAALRAAGATTAIFHGPHAYVSPRWYLEYDVPTWNYVVVHVRGRARLIEGDDALRAMLAALVARFEAPFGGPAGPLVPSDLAAPGMLAAAIVGFEIDLDTVEAKVKLSQNRGAEDRARVAAELRKSMDSTERAVAELMDRA